MKIQHILFICIAVFSNGLLALGFDERYKAYSGDLDADGDTDLYIRREPEVILLHGDIVTPIVLPGYVEDFVMQSNGDGSFTQLSKSALTSAQQSALENWVESASRLLLGDYNADGVVDVFIDLANEYLNYDDMILYAASSSGQVPQAYKRVDGEFKNFSEQLFNWLVNSNYFDENAVPVYDQQTVVDSLYVPEYCGTASESEMAALPPVTRRVRSSEPDLVEEIAWLLGNCLAAWGLNYNVHYDYVEYQWTETVQIGLDYSGFNQDAYILSTVLETVQVLGEIVSGSAGAQDIEVILERVLGSEYMGGVLTLPGTRTADEIDLDSGNLDSYRWSKLWTLLNYLIVTERSVDVHKASQCQFENQGAKLVIFSLAPEEHEGTLLSDNLVKLYKFGTHVKMVSDEIQSTMMGKASSEETREIQAVLNKIFATPKGAQVKAQLSVNDPLIVILNNRGVNAGSSFEKRLTVTTDSSFYFLNYAVPGTPSKTVSLERLLTHEMGHAVLGLDDDLNSVEGTPDDPVTNIPSFVDPLMIGVNMTERRYYANMRCMNEVISTPN
ncbi:MAG: VCBS repeat-containing protein [Exilibacterium sp.]